MQLSLQSTTHEGAFALKKMSNNHWVEFVLLILALYENAVDAWVFKKLRIEYTSLIDCPVSTNVIGDVVIVIYFFFFPRFQNRKCSGNLTKFLCITFVWIFCSMTTFFLELLSCRNEKIYLCYYGGSLRAILTQICFFCAAMMVTEPCMLDSIEHVGMVDISVRTLLYTLFVTSRCYSRNFVRENSRLTTAPNLVLFTHIFFVNAKTLFTVMLVFVVSHFSLLKIWGRVDDTKAPSLPSNEVHIDAAIAAKLKEMEAGMGPPQPGRRRYIF